MIQFNSEYLEYYLFNCQASSYSEMLKATSNILVSESNELKKNKILAGELSGFSKNHASQENIDTINTVKIDFTKMSQTKVTSGNFTQCQCGAILTTQDEVSNLQKDGEFLTWHCRYCRTANRSKQIHYSSNATKVILDKNIQRGFLPPIILFVIDISGSMGQSISVEVTDYSKGQSNLVVASKQMLDILKSSSFQQKQMYKQAQLKSQYRFQEQRESFRTNSKMKGANYFSKISLFMAIIENYLNKLKSLPQYSEFRIGFVFFNEGIYILKPTKQKMIPTFVEKNTKFNKEFPFEKNAADFHNFDGLYNSGKKFERFFADSRLKSCDLTKLMVQNLQTEGQTALGPALALALGIAQVHDIGSRIILISDSTPNIGVLSPETEQQNQSIYMHINKFLEIRKTTIGVLNWMSDESKSYQQKSKTQFIKFLNSNKERIVEISLDFTLRKSHIDILNTARKTLESLINRGSLGQVMSLKVFTSCPRVQATKFKYEDINFRQIKFLGMQRKNWIQLKLKKLLQQDFLFPVYTQMVVTYEDVFTKEKYIFMSYVKHKIIKSASEKQIYQYLDGSHQGNINELMDLQKLFNFDRENIILESVASRNFEMQSKKASSRGGRQENFSISFCQSLNSLAVLQNRRYEDDQDEHSYL